MDKKNETIFNLRIVDIKVVKFSQFELLEEFDVSRYPLVEYQTNFDFKVVEKDNKIKTIITVKIVMLETKEIFAELIVETSFLVSPIEKIAVKVDETKYDVKSIVLYNIATVSLSTIRGILFEKLKGSVIQKEIYPMVNLADMFLKENVRK